MGIRHISNFHLRFSFPTSKSKIAFEKNFTPEGEAILTPRGQEVDPDQTVNYLGPYRLLKEIS
jgi:hypothetical protein